MDTRFAFFTRWNGRLIQMFLAGEEMGRTKVGPSCKLKHGFTPINPGRVTFNLQVTENGTESVNDEKVELSKAGKALAEP